MYIFTNNTLTNIDDTLEQVVNDLKSKVITYMILNHNIPWLNDETEKALYDIIFEFLEPIILGKFLS
jgi:hypothetical protein